MDASADYKRYVVLENGQKFFNKGIPFGDEWLYERMGYEHLYNLYLDVVCHKTATLRCDYLHRIGFDRYPLGESKVLTHGLESTDISRKT